MPNLCFKESPFSKIKFVPHKFCFCAIQMKGRFVFIKFPFCQGKPKSAHPHMLILSLVPFLFLFSKFMISASYIFHKVIFKTQWRIMPVYTNYLNIITICYIVIIMVIVLLWPCQSVEIFFLTYYSVPIKDLKFPKWLSCSMVQELFFCSFLSKK